MRKWHNEHSGATFMQPRRFEEHRNGIICPAATMLRAPFLCCGCCSALVVGSEDGHGVTRDPTAPGGDCAG
jgi:hypothetical protein